MSALKHHRVFWLPLIAIMLSAGLLWAQECRELYQQANQESSYRAKLPLYQKAVELCPDLPEAWNNLADAEENLGLTDQAVGHYQKALTINPRLAIAHFSLGDIYLKRGEYKRASAAYIEGLKIEPGDELALKNLYKAEVGIQSAGGVLSSEYIAERLGTMKLMGSGGSRPRLAFLNILFDFNSDRIKPQSKKQLDEIGLALNKVIKVCGQSFLIEGHTDNAGQAEYNLDLSERRAARVKAYLVNNYGLDDARLPTKGYGLNKPVASNDSEEGRAQNRRVEISMQDSY